MCTTDNANYIPLLLKLQYGNLEHLCALTEKGEREFKKVSYVSGIQNILLILNKIAFFLQILTI